MYSIYLYSVLLVIISSANAAVTIEPLPTVPPTPTPAPCPSISAISNKITRLITNAVKIGNNIVYGVTTLLSFSDNDCQNLEPIICYLKHIHQAENLLWNTFRRVKYEVVLSKQLVELWKERQENCANIPIPS